MPGKYVMISRRKFLLGASSVTLCLNLEPASAILLRRGLAPSASTGFNGGKSQGQSNNNMSTNLEFPFINLLKTGLGWLGTDSDNTGAYIDPSWLASDGYPLASALSGSSFGVVSGINLPQKSTWLANSLGNLVLMWDVNSAGATDAWSVTVGNFATTPVSGSKTGTGNGTNFTYVFDPTNGYNNVPPGGGASLQVGINSLSGTAHITNMRLTFVSLIPSGDPHLASTVFNPQFITKVKALNAGVWRFLDWWGTGVSNVTTWATRKSVGFPTYISDEFRASLFPGDVMTNTSSNNLDYQLSTSATPYTWPGFTSAPIDKQSMHIILASNPVLVQNGESAAGYSNNTLTISGFGSSNTLIFGWTLHPLSNGDPVSINQNNVGGSPMNGTNPSQIYYVVNKATNTFQLSTTSGGSPISTPDTSSLLNNLVTRLQTINLNGNGAVPILSGAGRPFTFPVATGSAPLPQRTIGSTTKLYGTMVYDATFKAWLLFGATNNSSTGLTGGVPPEVCLELCKECGMHPHLSVPFLCLDNFTDFVPSLDAYIQANMPSWMIPHYEPANEVWNSVSFVTPQAYGKSFLYWGTQFDADNWYGMVLSIFGQALKTSRGGVGPGSTYEVLCGMQTMGSGGIPLSTTNDRLDSTQWVSHGSPAKSPYTIQAASLTTSAGLLATYVNPGYQGTLTELELAWQYYNGASPGQMTTLNAYADSMNIGISGTSILTLGSPGVVHWPAHGRSVGDPIFVGSTGALPIGASQAGVTGLGNFVQSVIDADHFTLSSSMSNGVVGAAQNWSGTQSGTQFVSLNGFSVNATYIHYINWNTLFVAKGLSKMFAYEGGYSSDLLFSFQSCNSPISGTITKANPTVITLPYTNTQPFGWQLPGTPAQIGMPLALTSVGGMTQLNCISSGVTLTDASASISWASNILIAGQVVMFEKNVNLLKTNITALTPYYVIATGLSTSAFQISATKGGSAITISITGGGTVAATADSGWAVTAVSGNNVSLDVDSSAFGTHTANTGTVTYIDSPDIINAFQTDVLQLATDLPAQLLVNYNNFTAAGGLFPSKYGFCPGGYGVLSTWEALGSDVWGPFNQEGLMIQVYN